MTNWSGYIVNIYMWRMHSHTCTHLQMYTFVYMSHYTYSRWGGVQSWDYSWGGEQETERLWGGLKKSRTCSHSCTGSSEHPKQGAVKYIPVNSMKFAFSNICSSSYKE